MTRTSKPMEVTSPTLHLTIVFTMMVFLIALLMSVYFHVEIVARGQGKVIPVGQVQVVQPEFSGRVTAIHVRNGSQVEQGDVLVELDTTDAIAQMGTITVELDRLIIESARVTALSSVLVNEEGKEDMMDAVLASFRLPDRLKEYPFVAEERKLIEAEVVDFQSYFEQMDAREEANIRSESMTKSNISRVKASLNYQAERLGISTKLLGQGTVSRASFLVTQQEYVELEQSRNIYLRELEKKTAERVMLKTERRRFVAKARSDFLKRISNIEARIATLKEQQRAVKRRIEVATLIAPSTGTIDQLNVFTIGGIAEAREELMRVVPTNVEIEIEALFSNQDIGFMSVGQLANVRLDAYPSERFGFVQGSVSDLAADAIEVSDGEWGYRVRISIDSPALVTGSNQFLLRPGMTSTIDVTTGKRRLISYFFAPILHILENSLGER